MDSMGVARPPDRPPADGNAEPSAATSSAPASLIGKTAWSTLASASSTISSALTLVIVARVLGVTGAGEVAYALFLGSTVAQVMLFGLPQAAMRFIASPSDRQGLARWTTRWTLALVIPASIAAAAFSYASGRAPGLVSATACLTTVAMLAAVGQAQFAGTQRFRPLAMLSMTAAVLQLAGAALGAVLAGAVGAVVGHCIAQVPLSMAALVHGDTGTPPVDVRRRASAFALETWVALTAALVAWSRLEFVFLQARGAGVVALYATALALMQLSIQPVVLLSAAVQPHFGELVSGGHLEAARETFAAVTRVFGFVTFPVCLGLAAIAPALIPLVFGRGFAPAAPAASIVVAASCVLALSPGASGMLFAHDRTRFNAIVAMSSGVLALSMFAVLIPRAGIVGAAAARSIVQAAGVMAGFLYAVHRLNAPAPYRQLGGALGSAAVAAVAGRLVVNWRGATWGSALAGTAVVAALYALATRYFRVLVPEDVRRLEPLLAPVPRQLRRPIVDWMRSVAR